MKIYLRGFFSENLGDDLFIHILAERYPNVNFVLISNSEYAVSYSDEKNVEVIKQNMFDRVIQKIRKNVLNISDIYDQIENDCDASVLIGGSLFQEISGDDGAIKRLETFPGKYSKKTYVLGANFGPFHSQDYLDATMDYLKSANDVCFRDRYSFNFFKELSNVRYARDIVFNIDTIIPKKECEDKYVVISVIDFRTRRDLSVFADDYVKFIRKEIGFYHALGYSVHIVSFCKAEGDESAISEILEGCRGKNEIIEYNGLNWKEIVSDISGADLIIATRFHSMILGFVYQIPTIPVIYNKKCLNILDDLGLSDRGVKTDSLRDISPEQLDPIIIKEIDDIKRESENQFLKLDDFLGRK